MASYQHLITIILLLFLSSGMAGCTGGSYQQPSVSYMPRAGTSGQLEYTIVLANYRGAGSMEQAQRVQQQAQQLLSEDIWLSYQEPDTVMVNYGHFQGSDKSSQTQREWQKVKQPNFYSKLKAGAYQFSYIRELPQVDPAAPDEWNLLNSDCFYSLEIGTYFNVPDASYYNRKADAVAGVRNLRAEGKTAFFVHGQKESRVYVGCFPREAVQTFNQHGKVEITLAPLAQLMIDQYQFWLENGAKVITVQHTPQGQEFKIPRKPVLVNIDLLAEEINF